jgi:tetratricopeptide (TPR) repeat protein
LEAAVKKALAVLSLVLCAWLCAGPLLAESSAEEVFSQGEQRLAEKDWKGAAKQFSQAAELRKNYWEAYNKWGVALYNQGDVFDAVVKLKEAVAMDPRFTEAWYNLGMGYENLDNDRKLKGDDKAKKKLEKTQFEQAVQAYRKALEIDPMNDERAVADSHFRLGVLLRDMELKKPAAEQNFKEPISHLEAAVRMFPDYPEAHNELGRIYDIIGRYPEAIDEYGKAIQGHAYYAQAFSNRGIAWWHDGNWDNALADCRKATEIDPKFAGGHYNLAEVVFARVQEIKAKKSDKDFALVHPEVQKAVDEYSMATQVDPTFTAAWLGLGKAYRAYFDFDKANDAYQHVLSMDKRNAEAKQSLKDIKAEQKAFVNHVPKQYQNSEMVPK